MFIYIFINFKLNFDFILKNFVVMDVQFFEDDLNQKKDVFVIFNVNLKQ